MCRAIPRLEGLYLSSNQLSGRIPSSISQCSQLRQLYLSFNKFSGPIPREIGNLSALEYLAVGANNLAGEIPHELGNLKNLRLLSMGGNILTGSIPGSIFNITYLQSFEVQQCTLDGAIPKEMCSLGSQLEAVSFDDNKLVGQLPDTIGQCSKLRILSLSNNNLTGTVPETIGNLLNLKYLGLGYNGLTGLLSEKIFNISTLKTLYLSENRLSGTLPKSLSFGLPNLEEMYLCCNMFTGLISESISNSSSLTRIELHDNSFNGRIPDSFGKLRFLRKLYLYANNFISESKELSIITSLTNCTNLENLLLGDSPTLSGTLPVTIGNFSLSLQYLSMDHMDLFGRIPDEICNLRNLIFLNLAENKLTGPIPHNLASLHKLQILVLEGNILSGTIPNGICELQHLEFITMSRNQIEGSVPDCIGEITTLRSFYIEENRLSSGIPMSLWRLNDLLDLNLSSNFLTGLLPTDIGNMKALLTLGLSKNRFSSNIPDSIGNLQNLKNLSLAKNRFTGSIPESIGDMLSLVNVDLSHNNLSGNIPKSLQSVRDLSYFDVSFNKLSGQIPPNGSFKNFPSQFFASNEGLCGDPRYGVPVCPTTHSNESKRRKLFTAVVCSVLGVTLIASAMALAFIVARHRRKNEGFIQTSIRTETAPVRVSYYDILNSTEGFNESHLIGVGGFSSVYRGTLRDGKLVAMKVLDLNVEGVYANFDTECELLSSLRHRNLCKIIGVCSNESFKSLVLEYMPNGSLEKCLYSEDCFLDVMQRVNIMVDVACALEYLHHGYSVQVVHRDLKPSNVLLDENMIARLSDFGISKLLSRGDGTAHTTTLATFGYMAPEYGSEGLVSIKCDVYSYGILLMEVFTKIKPSSDRFVGNLTLKGLVYGSWPNEIMRVIDSKLIRQDEELFVQTLECLSSIFELALECSIDTPNERISMKHVVVQLRKIQMKLFTGSEENKRQRGNSANVFEHHVA